jgi:hypothetical protein
VLGGARDGQQVIEVLPKSVRFELGDEGHGDLPGIKVTGQGYTGRALFPMRPAGVGRGGDRAAGRRESFQSPLE